MDGASGRTRALLDSAKRQFHPPALRAPPATVQVPSISKAPVGGTNREPAAGPIRSGAPEAAPDRAATAADVAASFAVLHGRAAEPAVVRDRRGQPLRLILQAALCSEEFRQEVVQPVIEGRTPRARLHLPREADDAGSFLLDIGVDGAGASTPLALLERLQASDLVRSVLAGRYASQVLADFSEGLAGLGAVAARSRPLGAPADAPLVVRSEALRLQGALAFALGAEQVGPRFVARVAQALGAVRRSGGPLADRLGAVPLGRWLLDRPDEELIDFGRWPAQLRVVADLCFRGNPALERRAAEIGAVDRLLQEALALELVPAAPGRPAFTLAMAALALITEGRTRLPASEAATEAAVRRFLQSAPFHPSFERRLTRVQRRALADACPDRTGAAALAALTAEDLAERRIAMVTAADGTERPELPDFLAAATLRALLRPDATGERLDQTGIAPSALAWAAGRPDRGPRLPPDVAGTGRRPLRIGRQLAFDDGGEGRRHLLAGSWWQGEVSHSWSRRPTALLAFHLDPADGVRGLDLLLRFMTGPQAPGVLEVIWNGQLVGWLQPEPGRVQQARVHLGVRHRHGLTPNILGLAVDAMFELPGDNRRLGLALCDLTFLPR